METAYEIQARAYAMFDAWLRKQPDGVQQLELLEQIEMYAKDLNHD